MKKEILLMFFCFVSSLGSVTSKNPATKITNSNCKAYTHFVDLGLPSGTLWADRNLGAKEIRDLGYRYAWGEIAPKLSFWPENYKYAVEGDEEYEISKYVSERDNSGYWDGLKDLTPEDDPATDLLGIACHTPTKAQFMELIECCKVTWLAKRKLHGCQIKGPNGKTIFLPAGGVLLKDAYKKTEWTPKSACYWTSTASEWMLYAHAFVSNDTLHRVLENIHRVWGLPVRAVMERSGSMEDAATTVD